MAQNENGVSSKAPDDKIVKENKKKEFEPTLKPNWALRILTVLLIFIGGSAFGIYLIPTLKERIPFVASWLGEGNTTDQSYLALNEKLLGQQKVIADLSRTSIDHENRLNQLSDNETLSASNENSESLLSRIEQLEEKLSINIGAQKQSDETSQSARVDMLLSRMSQLEASLVPLSKNMMDAQTATQERKALEQNTLSLSNKLSDIENRLQNVETIAAKDNKGILLNLKVAELRRKITAGLPYSSELSSVKQMIEESTLKANERFSMALDQLTGKALTGMQTPDQLEKRFNDLIPEILKNDMAGTATSWWQNTLNQLKNLITVRKTDGAAFNDGSIDSLILDIERWLKSADIKSALDTLNAMPQAAQTLLNNWKKEAETWLKNEEALQDLESIAAEDYLTVKKDTGSSPTTETKETTL